MLLPPSTTTATRAHSLCIRFIFLTYANVNYHTHDYVARHICCRFCSSSLLFGSFGGVVRGSCSFNTQKELDGTGVSKCCHKVTLLFNSLQKANKTLYVYISKPFENVGLPL